MTSISRALGGCSECDADMTITMNASGVWVLTVRHDPACPQLAEADPIRTEPSPSPRHA